MVSRTFALILSESATGKINRGFSNYCNNKPHNSYRKAPISLPLHKKEDIRKLNHQVFRLIAKRIVMINFKVKKAIWTTIYTSDASYIKNFNVAQLNWERNKQDGKSLQSSRVLVRK